MPPVDDNPDVREHYFDVQAVCGLPTERMLVQMTPEDKVALLRVLKKASDMICVEYCYVKCCDECKDLQAQIEKLESTE